MEISTPIIVVRPQGDQFEYYIKQGDKFVNFYLDRATHEALKHAQSQADLASQNAEPADVPLRVVEA